MGEKHHAEYTSFTSDQKSEVLQTVLDYYSALSAETDNWVANLANASSLVWHAYHDLKIPVNWAGFYVLDPSHVSQLVLGPFQGKVACQTIAFGKGVCGTAASTKETQLVPNVDEFPGHIACDGETQSEIVVPVVVDGKVMGVLDIDCLAKNGFDEEDKKYLELLAQAIATSCKW
ncbi:hypothetical protein PUMCH_001315 [Australozyma saopauloensis]|uniref:GAF domain-containing protein n=1 Tax=Australozyma saopauloensis TaxID=291208 RepID=A0AAX4H6S8_9ASCO|nr:hypothetical protein PUMCH_001315 [[Candida] saopauloensis]